MSDVQEIIERLSSWEDMIVNCAGVPQNPDSLPQMLLHEIRKTLADLRTPSPGVGEENEALALARECFLNMMADAEWEVDVDGDTDAAGRSVVYVTHRIEVDGFTFDQLPEALGIGTTRMETMEDAIRRAIDEPPALPHQPAKERE